MPGTPPTGVPSAGETPPFPFSDAFDAGFFETASLGRRLDEVSRRVREGAAIVVIEGERGSGRTSFLREFLRRTPADWAVCAIAARIALGERHVLAGIGRCFWSDPSIDARVLAERLVERGRRGSFSLIVIDDVDRLTAFAVQALLDLKRAVAMTGGRLGVVLTATPQTLNSLFVTPSLREYADEWFVRIGLSPFTEGETADYIRQRIEAAGRAGEMVFSGAQLKTIHKRSRGIPRHVNRLARDVVTGTRIRRFRAQRQREPMTRRHGPAIAAGVLCVVLTALGYLVYASWTERRLVAASLVDAPARQDGGVAVTEGATATPGTITQAVAVPGTIPGNMPTEADPPAQSGRSPGAMTPARAEPASEGMPVRETSRQSGDIGDGAAPLPASSPDPGISDSGISDSGGTAIDAVTSAGDRWLMAQDPDAYTIQLAGAPDLAKARAFIDTHPLTGEVVSVRTLRGKRTWYLVLYNRYPSWAAAQRDIAALPPEIQKNKPFARRIATVQAIAAASED